MTRRSAVMFGLFGSAVISRGQEGERRKSPHETVSVDLGGKKISITYGRPSLKGRHLGDSMAPYNKVWRLGADEATKLTVDQATSIGPSLSLQPGSYSLFAIPQAKKWTIIVNKTADQWGAFNYSEAQDVGRFDLDVKPTATVEEFTISLKKTSANKAALSMAWDKAMVSTTLTV